MRVQWTRLTGGLCFLAVASWCGGAPARGQDVEVNCSGDLVPLTLPVAPACEEDKDDDPDKRYIINLTKDGGVHYKGKRYSLTELTKVLNRLKRHYSKYKDYGKPPNLFRLSQLYLLLRVDKDAPWRHVQWLMAVLEEQKLYRVQFGVKLKADRDYTAEEAALLGAVLTDKRPRAGLEGKLFCFLRYAFVEVEADRPLISIEISGKEYKRTKRGPEGLKAWVFPPRKAVYFVARRRTDEVRTLGGWIRNKLADLPERKSRLDVVGRIEAEADTPFKFVVAAMNQFNDARVEAFDFGPAVIPDAAVRKRAYLPYPKLR